MQNRAMLPAFNPSEDSKMKPCFKRSLLFCLPSLALILCLAGMSVAQTSLATGRLDGTVYDKTGAAVAGATTTVRNEATGVTFSQTSDENGRFTFLNLE